MDKLIEQWIKVDAIICDPPYGTTKCSWDSVIPFEPMWERLNKLIKPNGAILLFWSQPFTSTLIMSNIKMFRYEIIYEKNIASNFAFAKHWIMKFHENILFFSNKKGKVKTYNPQMTIWKPNNSVWKWNRNRITETTANTRIVINKTDWLKHPKSVQKFNRETGLHPTQKPVALMEYLIKTYTNEWETVLDFTAWSWTTGLAANNTNRNYILIEKEKEYINIINKRLNI